MCAGKCKILEAWGSFSGGEGSHFGLKFVKNEQQGSRLTPEPKIVCTMVFYLCITELVRVKIAGSLPSKSDNLLSCRETCLVHWCEYL